MDALSGTMVISQGNDIDERYAPHSTYKILLSLVGYDSGILQDEEHPVWSYDRSLPSMGQQTFDQTPKSWIRLSIIWYSRLLAQKIGKERLTHYVSLFSYGNQDISGDGDFKQAHLDSSLTISPREQISFLQNLALGMLPVSSHAIRLTKKLLLAKTYPSGWRLFGKTGTSSHHGFAWYVGWIERGEEKYVFALFVKDEKRLPSKEERQELVKRLFSEAHIQY